MEKELLIDEVYRRKVLWDPSNRDYNKRDKAKKAWQEVANILKTDCECAKKAWKNLRDNYRVEIKKIKDKDYRSQGSKWVYFKKMNFLRDVLEHGATRDPTSIDNAALFSFGNNDNENYAEDGSLHDDDDEDETDEYTSNEFPDFNVNTKRKAPIRFATAKRRKNHHKDENDAFTKFYQIEKLKLLREDNKMKNDSDYNFLLSFLSPMKGLCEINNMKFRMEVTKAFMNLKESEGREVKRNDDIQPTLPTTTLFEYDELDNDPNRDWKTSSAGDDTDEDRKPSVELVNVAEYIV